MEVLDNSLRRSSRRSIGRAGTVELFSFAPPLAVRLSERSRTLPSSEISRAMLTLQESRNESGRVAGVLRSPAPALLRPPWSDSSAMASGSQRSITSPWASNHTYSNTSSETGEHSYEEFARVLSGRSSTCEIERTPEETLSCFSPKALGAPPPSQSSSPPKSHHLAPLSDHLPPRSKLNGKLHKAMILNTQLSQVRETVPGLEVVGGWRSGWGDLQGRGRGFAMHERTVHGCCFPLKHIAYYLLRYNHV